MDEEWGLSMEELDSLERNAKRQLVERQYSSSSASSPPPGFASSSSAWSSPSKTRVLPATIFSSPSKASGRQVSIKFFRDRPGRIALETQYNPHIVTALKSVPGHEWDQNRRLWTYPEEKLEAILLAISPLSHIVSNIATIWPLSLPTLQWQEGPGPPESISPMKSQVDFAGSPKIKKGQQIPVQIYLMTPDLIAARNPYHEKVKEACQSVSGRSWNKEERVWTFPKSSLEELVQSLLSMLSDSVLIEAIPPLVLPDSVSLKITGNQEQGEGLGMECQQSQDSAVQRKLVRCSVKMLLHSSGCVAARFEYQPRLVSVLRSIPRAEWNARERLWLFPLFSLEQTEKALLAITDLCVNVEPLEPLIRRALEVSMNLPDMRGRYCKIPEDLETQLLPFQRDGIRFVLHHGGRSLIADEMGLGKTLQAIAVASCFEEDWPVLVITPSSLRLHWAAMINQWLHIRPIDIVVVMPLWAGSNYEGFNIVQSAGKQPIQFDGLFNIVSYDLVSKLQNEIAAANFKIIIADEAHYMKNAQAKRTNACVPLLQRSKYAILLSGTPALSRPIELYKQLEALQPGVYKNVHEYGRYFCMGGFFGVYQGASNCEELHALMKSTVMIRRLKRDVLSQLPLKRRQQIFLSLDEKGQKQMRALFLELESIKRSINSCNCQEETEKLKYSEKQLINKIYTDSAEVKRPGVQDYLSTVVEDGCKFLIFAHHQVMLDGIEEFLEKKKVEYIRIDGSTPASSRLALVTKFQDRDNVKAAVLGIRAAGLGLTLTAASTVIFAEMSWTPGDLVQAEDRAHRIGQESSVNVYYLHAHDTVDDLIWETVQHKLENVGQVLDGREGALHVSAAGRHHYSRSQGQSTLTSFLYRCQKSFASPDQGSDGHHWVLREQSQHNAKNESNSIEKDTYVGPEADKRTWT